MISKFEQTIVWSCIENNTLLSIICFFTILAFFCSKKNPGKTVHMISFYLLIQKNYQNNVDYNGSKQKMAEWFGSPPQRR